MVDTEYIIRTADVTLPVEHIQTDPSDANNRTRGGTVTIDAYVNDPMGELVVPSGETYTVPSGETQVYGGADIDGTLAIDGELIIYGTVDNDGTINNNGILTIHNRNVDPFAELLEFDRHAGSYSLESALNNTQRYKERLPTTPNVSSLVVGIEPNNELQTEEIAGKWGLISNITDSRTRALTNDVITIEIDILADLAEYSDLNNVQTALKI